MTWSYSGDPSTTPMDCVRFLTGDTLRNDQQRQNEEIDWTLTETGDNVYLAGALVCDSLASQYARDSDKSSDDLREQLSQRSRAYAARAAELRERAAAGTSGIALAVPHAGGISQARIDAAADDTDYPAPAFRPGMFDEA